MAAPTCPECGGEIQATVDVDMTLTTAGWEIATTGGDYRLYCANDCDAASFDEIEAPNVTLMTYGPEDVECLHCGFPVVHGSGAAVTCDLCGAFCCEDHHVRHAGYRIHAILAPESDDPEPADAGEVAP